MFNLRIMFSLIFAAFIIGCGQDEGPSTTRKWTTSYQDVITADEPAEEYKSRNGLSSLSLGKDGCTFNVTSSDVVLTRPASITTEAGDTLTFGAYVVDKLDAVKNYAWYKLEESDGEGNTSTKALLIFEEQGYALATISCSGVIEQ
jgi:hypothetical protein